MTPLLLAWLTLAAKAPKPVVPPNQVTLVQEGGTFKVDQPLERLRVQLSQMPPSRTRVYMVAADGTQATLEWDPLTTTALSQEVDVPGSGALQISVQSEPLLIQVEGKPGTDIPRALADLSWAAAPKQETSTPNRINLVRRDSSSNSTVAFIAFSAATKLDAVTVAKQLAISEGGRVGGRALGDELSRAAEDTLRLLAEIALDRAKARSAAVLVAKLQRTVCEEVLVPTRVWADSSFQNTWLALHPGNVELKDLPAPPLLPRTCQSVSSLKFTELVSTGRALLKQVFSDLLSASLAYAEWEVARRLSPDDTQLALAVLQQLGDLLQRAIDGASPPTPRELQLMVVHLAESVATGVGGVEGKDVAHCGLVIAFAAVSACQADGRCDARRLEDLVVHWPDHFKGPPACQGLEKDLKKQWPELPALASRALDVVRPAASTKLGDLSAKTADLAVEVIEQFLERRGNLPIELRRLLAVVRDLRALGAALVSANSSEVALHAVGIGTQLLKDVPEADSDKLRRAAALLAGLTDYAQVYVSTQGAKDPTAATEARKAALEALIDSETDRRGRGGDMVYSIGSSVGFAGFLAQNRATVDAERNYTGWGQLTLPLAISMERLPRGKQGACPFGWHLQLSMLDLGQFLPVDGSPAAIDWKGAFFLGAQGAITLGTPSDVFMIGVDLRIAPNVRRDVSVPFHFGLFAAYYVPFLDMN